MIEERNTDIHTNRAGRKRGDGDGGKADELNDNNIRCNIRVLTYCTHGELAVSAFK